MPVYNQFFSTSSPIDTNPLKIFGIEAGDAFIRNTDIEGHSTSHTYRRFLLGMEAIVDSHQLAINLEPFRQALRWADRIEAIRSDDQLTKQKESAKSSRRKIFVYDKALCGPKDLERQLHNSKDNQ